MAFNPTPSQTAAIEQKGCVLVSAAAGSGKTAVLVERVIKMLTDRENPVPANRLLIVTFTNAAAAEMLARIESRLYAELEKNPADELISRQKYLIKSADICTIDSFCIRLVRDNFALCGVEPDFRVTDDNSLSAIRSEVLSRIIDGYLLSGNSDFNLLLDLANCKFGEGNLNALIDSVYKSSLKMPFPKEYIEGLKSPYTVPFSSGNIWYDYCFSYADSVIKSIRQSVEKLAEEALFCEASADASNIALSVSGVIASVDEAVKSNDWNTLFNTLSASDIPNSRKKLTDSFKSIRKEICADIDSVREFFYASKEEIEGDIAKLLPAVSLFCRIVEEYSNELFKRLCEENVFSFDDVEQLAMSMLAYRGEDGKIENTPQASEIISRYDEVLVDEFQDVNDLQNTLFEVLSDNAKNLFIVGDVKQSIYSFRGSNPDIFLEKKEKYGDYNTDENTLAKRIFLSDNFRSREGICESVNYFFKNLLKADVGGLVYDDSEKLNYKANFSENGASETDFMVIDKVDDDSDDSAILTEAAAIGDYIKEVMASGNILSDKNGGLRPAQYGDFCILLAALKEKSGVIADALTARGIPAKVNDINFFGSTEITTALALLHVIDNPQSDVYLLSALMSPIYGFTAEDMAKIRIEGKDTSLYSALCRYAASDEKAHNFISVISAFRRMSCMLPVSKFVSYVIDKTDMMNIFYSLPGGELRAENLMLLMRLADEYAGDLGGGLFGFLRYIESLPEDSVRASGSEDERCVKIMSIHRSKGLQFPICIVAGLGLKINRQSCYGACLFEDGYGIGFKYYDRQKGDKTDTLAHRIIRSQKLRKTAQERLRLIYVAMTRAEERLCLVCCQKDAQKSLISAAQASEMGTKEISGKYIMQADNSAKYILAAAIMHPDAGILRNVAETDVKTANTNSRISFRFIDAAKLDTATEQVNSRNTANGDTAEMIKQNISYVYPFEALAGIPAKTSVSKLENSAEIGYFDMCDRPAFMEKGGLSAAGKGTAMHKIMQFIKFNANPDIENEISNLLKEKRITENEAACLDRGALSQFFASDIYKRITSASDVKREMRFLTEVPVSRLLGESVFEDKFIVQGAVDLCFVEADGVVVLDFKTDNVDSLEELKERYSGQLGVYADACEKIFGMPVKERIIYSFKLSGAISV